MISRVRNLPVLDRVFGIAMLLIGLCLGTVGAQQQTTFHYGLEEGIPSLEVYSVIQDKKGFLWFGTDNGVVRYDGNSTRVYESADGLTDPVVFGFYMDARERLWFRTFSGRISYIENDTIRTYRYNNLIQKYTAKEVLHSIVYDDLTKSLYLSAGNVLVKIDSTGNEETLSDPKSMINIQTLPGGIIYGTKNLLNKDYVLRINGNGINFPYGYIENKEILPLTADPQKLFFALGNQIFLYRNNSVVPFLTVDHQIISLTLEENYLWIGTFQSGIERINLSNLNDRWKPEDLKNESVSSFQRDYEGGMWFTTLTNGCFYLPEPAISTRSIPTTSNIQSHLFNKGIFFWGESNGKIGKLNPETMEVTTIETGKNVLSLFIDSQNQLWAANKDINTSIYNLELQKQKEVQYIRMDFTEDSVGNVWTIGSQSIYIYNKQANRIQSYPSTNWRTIYIRGNKLFLAGRTGIEIRNFNYKLLAVPPEFHNLKITQLLDYNDTTIAMASRGAGVVLYNPTTGWIRQLNSRTNFFSDNIFSMYRSEDYLWVGTDKGIAAINIHIPPEKMRYKIINKSSGLGGDYIRNISESGTNMLVMNENGISLIPKSLLVKPDPEIRFYLESIKVNNLPSELTQLTNLAFYENNISVDFGYLTYKHQKNLRTRYRLNQKEEWKYTTAREINFNSLSPGVYNLEIEFSIDNTQWRPAFYLIEISILYPWWRQWQFIVTAVFLTIVLAFSFINNRIQLVKANEKNLEIINENQSRLLQAEIQATERERLRIAKDLHDTVGTNLAAAKMLVTNALSRNNDPITEEAEKQLQRIVDETREIIYNLSPPGIDRYGLITLIKNQIDRLQKVTAIKIQFTSYGKEIIDKDLNVMIIRILQELITNSIRHSQCRNINIDVSNFDDRLAIIYEDNGHGFNINEVNIGIGLNSIESRIRTKNGTISFESGSFGVSYILEIPLNKPISRSK